MQGLVRKRCTELAEVDKGQAIPFLFEAETPEQTERIGSQLGLLLEAGDVVTLSGELGGGKTCFVRGVVTSVAPQSVDMVASPTFALLNEYPGTCPVLHYDCYRLSGCDDALELGLEDHLGGYGICLIEWPERILDILPDNRIDLLFEYSDNTGRLITFVPRGVQATEKVEQLAVICPTMKKILSEEHRSAI
jgi:tRNA threonylcarbamoyladenosine biosynthesis protein TsaE